MTPAVKKVCLFIILAAALSAAYVTGRHNGRNENDDRVRSAWRSEHEQFKCPASQCPVLVRGNFYSHDMIVCQPTCDTIKAVP